MTTNELRKEAAEASERVRLAQHIAQCNQLVDLLEDNRLLRDQAKQAKEQARIAKNEAEAAKEALRLERERCAQAISVAGATV